MELDYECYGEGEALLGWLNATIRVNAPDGFVPDECTPPTGHGHWRARHRGGRRNRPPENQPACW